MKKNLICIIIFGCIVGGCIDAHKSSDDVQREQSEKLLSEATSQVGMPSIINFRERKLMKDIFERRDQEGLTTYTYLWNEMQGKMVFLGDTIGYGIPYSAQFTNPMKFELPPRRVEYHTIPQADPNGLFLPTSSSATWVYMLDPSSGEATPQYIEAPIIVLTFKLKSGDPRLAE